MSQLEPMCGISYPTPGVMIRLRTLPSFLFVISISFHCTEGRHPFVPYANSESIVNFAISPHLMVLMPISKPLTTCLRPTVKLKAWVLSRVDSTTVPSFSFAIKWTLTSSALRSVDQPFTLSMMSFTTFDRVLATHKLLYPWFYRFVEKCCDK